MKPSNRRMAVAGSLVAGMVASGPVWAEIETRGFFCSNCVDFESARQQAIQHAAPLKCEDQTHLDPDTPPDCWSRDRRVILGNHLTRQVFAFVVTRGDQWPWETTAEPISLSPDEELAYQRVLDLRVDWERILAEGMTMQPEAGTRSEGDSCPEGTALDWVLEPGKLSALKNMVTIEVTNNLEDYQNNRPWYIPELGAGVIFRGINASFRWPGHGDRGDDVYAIEWPSPGQPLNDVLVFDIELRGTTDSGQAILELDFNQKASRAAGFPLEDVLNGEALIKDECVLETLEKLEEADPEIDFRVGGPGGGSFDFTRGGIGDDGSVCSKTLCATVCTGGQCQCQFTITVATLCD